MSDPDYPFLDEPAPDDVVPETPAPEAVAETVEVVPQATPAPVAPTATEPVEATHVPLAALKAERDKRQAAERRIAEWERQQAQPKPEAPNFYENPEQFIAQSLSEREQQLTQRMHMALEEQAKEAYPDYDEVLAELTEYAQENPAVRQQVFSAANPALAAYKLGKQVRELKAMNDPAEYRKGVEAEVRKQLEAEFAARDQAKAAAVAAVPPDLAASRSSRDAEVIPDDSLDSILASRKR